ncbi:MAG: hypothetical protein J6C96_06690 [Oscillospiraceae bacterium]|nr:hypothetical protein [Oscillospiraceae bacterium]
MKKDNIVSIIIAAAAFALSAAALAAGIVALVKSCGKNKISASEYNFACPDCGEDEELGSDTLAF